jgi:ABC-2 type transport system ATP-binding protein
MVSLGIALLHQPRCILLDEPLTGLDAGNTFALIKAITDLREKRGVTFVIAEHRLEEAASFKGRTLVMTLGHLDNSAGSLEETTHL